MRHHRIIESYCLSHTSWKYGEVLEEIKKHLRACSRKLHHASHQKKDILVSLED
jgi:hypothetical protein